MSDILVVNGLSKSFGKLKAVDNLSFSVPQGEILGVLGPNGAGKTTLFSLITGEVKPDHGQVVLNGRDITLTPTFEKCRLGIARTYQIPRPFVNLTVLGNLMVGATYGADIRHEERREKCEEILKMTGLLSKKNALAGSLPLLELKKLELARGLATCPSLLLLDEIAAGLSETEVEEVLDKIDSVRKEGVTVLWVEHILTAMRKGPDRLLVINFGKEVFLGNIDETFKSQELQDIYLGKEV